MLRYQQQFTFFDVAKVNESVRFINLGQEALNAGLGEVLTRITQEVEATSPGVVIVDSFRSVGRVAKRQNGPLDLQRFVQELAMRLTGWQATTFLVGEYQLSESEDNPVFTVADGLLWLYQSIDRNSMVRKIQVMKLRGQAPIPGLHTFRITDNGVQVFPRLIIGPEETPASGAAGKAKRRRPRLSIGVKGVDEMLGGGIPAGYSVLVAGPSGSGKTPGHAVHQGGRAARRTRRHRRVREAPKRIRPDQQRCVRPTRARGAGGHHPYTPARSLDR